MALMSRDDNGSDEGDSASAVRLLTPALLRGLLKGRAKVGEHAVDVECDAERHQCALPSGSREGGRSVASAAAAASSQSTAGVTSGVSQMLCTARPMMPATAPSRTCTSGIRRRDGADVGRVGSR